MSRILGKLLCPLITEFLNSPFSKIDWYFICLIADLHLHNEWFSRVHLRSLWSTCNILVTVWKILSFSSEFIKAPYKGRGINCECTLLISHPQWFSSLTILLQVRDTVRLSLHQKKISWDSCAGKTVVQAKRNIRRYSLCWQNGLLDWLFLGYTWHYASIGMSQLHHLLL